MDTEPRKFHPLGTPLEELRQPVPLDDLISRYTTYLSDTLHAQQNYAVHVELCKHYPFWIIDDLEKTAKESKGLLRHQALFALKVLGEAVNLRIETYQHDPFKWEVKSDDPLASVSDIG